MKVISCVERRIIPRGLNKLALPLESKLKNYLFEKDYHSLTLLQKIRPLPLSPEYPILLYPGCGIDILFPLLYFDFLFPQIINVDLIFVDVENTFGLIKTILDDVGVSFAEERNRLKFYWKKKLVILEFLQKDIFGFISDSSPFDIYFERAFRIMKDAHPFYERQVFEKLNSGGIIISDSGFANVPLQRIPVPSVLSSYREMVIGFKQR